VEVIFQTACVAWAAEARYGDRFPSQVGHCLRLFSITLVQVAILAHLNFVRVLGNDLCGPPKTGPIRCGPQTLNQSLETQTGSTGRAHACSNSTGVSIPLLLHQPSDLAAAESCLSQQQRLCARARHTDKRAPARRLWVKGFAMTAIVSTDRADSRPISRPAILGHRRHVVEQLSPREAMNDASAWPRI
jgi:hypothetical protein